MIEGGKIYALMGSNGAGKTTLFNLISGFLRPGSGNIAWNNVSIVHHAPFMINRLGIGRTFQDLRLITKITVRENVILAMQNNPSDNLLKAILPSSFFRQTAKDFWAKANQIIEQFFLTNVANSLAGDISYGQQKLLTLANCTANGSSLMLLDEPVAGIQPDYRNKLATLILQLKKQGKTILLIDHDLHFISEIVDSIFFLNDGKIKEFDNVGTLRQDKSVIEAYI